MNEPKDASMHELLAGIAASLESARSDIIHSGKAAFDAIDAGQAHRAATRLEAIAEAEQGLWRLSELLDIAGICVEGAELGSHTSPPPVARARLERPRLPDGPAHLPAFYREPVLAVLRDAGRPVTLLQLWNALERTLQHQLNVSDLAIMPNHRKPRWRYVVAWTLTFLKKEGRVDNPRRGVWRLIEPR